jgi:hypothetical protein
LLNVGLRSHEEDQNNFKNKYGMIWSKHEQNRIVGVHCFDALHSVATNTYGKDYH